MPVGAPVEAIRATEVTTISTCLIIGYLVSIGNLVKIRAASGDIRNRTGWRAEKRPSEALVTPNEALAPVPRSGPAYPARPGAVPTPGRRAVVRRRTQGCVRARCRPRRHRHLGRFERSSGRRRATAESGQPKAGETARSKLQGKLA